MILNNIQFGNTYRLIDKVIRKRNMSGELKVLYERSRPYEESFTVEIYPLSDTKKDDLVTWLVGAAGQQIKITDQDNLNWIGMISSNPVVTDKGGTCKYQINFEFIGRIQ